jgi:hypothetical protein
MATVLDDLDAQNRTYTNWEDRPKSKQGDLAESLVDEYLDKRGWIISDPNRNTKGKHDFDRIAWHPIHDITFRYDVKAKTRMATRPITGVNETAWNGYLNVMHETNEHFLIFYLDRFEKECYVQSISQTLNEGQDIITENAWEWTWKQLAPHKYFALQSMHKVANISANTVEKLILGESKRYNGDDKWEKLLQTKEYTPKRKWSVLRLLSEAVHKEGQ